MPAESTSNLRPRIRRPQPVSTAANAGTATYFRTIND
jgi:hypothetical protein